MHDIVYLYVLALNKTLSENGDPRNGTLMFENAKTQTFQGKHVYTVNAVSLTAGNTC